MTIRCVDVCDVTTAGSRPSSGTAASYRSPGFTIPRPRRTAFHSGHISLRGLRELCPRSRKSVSSALGAALTSSHTRVARWHRHLLGAGFSRREARDSGRAAKASNATGRSCSGVGPSTARGLSGARRVETVVMKAKCGPLLLELPSIAVLGLFVRVFAALLRLSWMYL